ncbi:synaptic vesicle glycoprotein 2C-like isoform X3 [Nymphalis io]|uniref:synaptic vesicle glycoprotein 2C-like isoform X3 n=1 Tax=Inachis io TaxID=171585 RepID=UPI00216A5A1F|nr:synaptic vesicle glycoprotein 2C-like isoform X3 [Nymphalis io]
MVKNTIDTVSETIDEGDNAVDLDQALSVAGIGWYNIRYSLALSLFLISAIIDPVGYSYLLPAAKCDLQMTDAQRGVIGSIPYIGVVATSFPWGYLVDTRGRKKTIVYSSLAAGTFGVLAAFMPDLTSFTIFKLLSAFCIACPAAVPYSFIGEILPQKYRDITLSITNAMQISGSALVPLIAWAILPLDFRIDFGLYYFRPWRLLTIIYSSFFILSAILMSFGPESPKYLISQGRHDESLNVLRTIYSGNKRKPAADFPVKTLKLPDQDKNGQSFLNSLVQQTIPLLRPPYLKWFILNGTLFFGIFATLNGLYMWIPDILNRVLTGDSAGLTACEVIAQRLNETASENAQCNDSIDSITFVFNSIANFCCALIALGFSSTVKILGKKTLLILVYLVIGIFCVLINFVTQDTIFAILLSSIPITGLAIGPINAYAVEIFPTNLSSMAIGLTMMVGRTGFIQQGTNVASLLFNAVCHLTCYIIGAMLILCGLLTLLLPSTRVEPRPIRRTHF